MKCVRRSVQNLVDKLAPRKHDRTAAHWTNEHNGSPRHAQCGIRAVIWTETLGHSLIWRRTVPLNVKPFSFRKSFPFIHKAVQLLHFFPFSHYHFDIYPFCRREPHLCASEMGIDGNFSTYLSILACGTTQSCLRVVFASPERMAYLSFRNTLCAMALWILLLVLAVKSSCFFGNKAPIPI